MESLNNFRMLTRLKMYLLQTAELLDNFRKYSESETVWIMKNMDLYPNYENSEDVSVE